jgi:ribosomal-protein-alanine N-acetyltransferase
MLRAAPAAAGECRETMQEENPQSTPPDLVVRHAAEADLAALAALESASFGDPWSEDSLAAELTYPESVVLVAEAAGSAAPAGYAAYRALLGEGELLRLAVAPERRRRRVAAALLAAGDEALAAAGCDTCFLEVRADNQGAIAFYMAQGFHRIGRRRNYYGPGRDGLLFARAVRRPRPPRQRPGGG